MHLAAAKLDYVPKPPPPQKDGVIIVTVNHSFYTYTVVVDFSSDHSMLGVTFKKAGSHL